MPRKFKVTVNGREYDVAVLEVTTPGAANVVAAAHPAHPAPTAVQTAAPTAPVAVAATPAAAGAGDEIAQMGGVVVQIEVKVGQTVNQGDRLLVLEAMKMKSAVVSTRSGQVTRILVAVGDAVDGGQALLTIA
ncbi:MAG TPA: biotin/lipoyl-containing protein [Rhodocyclaceae bacterium]|nr:biotin/lipoyl-containing protein [Rhodocyclaceae bacterium]